jgi:hypothetical protein
MSMGPKHASFFTLYRNEKDGVVPGKILAPDGRPLISIDGPHSAPTQHVPEYTTVMVVGGGIGVTPVASTLKSVIFHRWRNTIGVCHPSHAYFYWVISWKDLDSFQAVGNGAKGPSSYSYDSKASSSYSGSSSYLTLSKGSKDFDPFNNGSVVRTA